MFYINTLFVGYRGQIKLIIIVEKNIFKFFEPLFIIILNLFQINISRHIFFIISRRAIFFKFFYSLQIVYKVIDYSTIYG